MDAYWARLKKHIRNAAEAYGMQDNIHASQKAKLLILFLREMEALDDSIEIDSVNTIPDVVTPDIEELRRQFLEDDAA